MTTGFMNIDWKLVLPRRNIWWGWIFMKHFHNVKAKNVWWYCWWNSRFFFFCCCCFAATECVWNDNYILLSLFCMVLFFWWRLHTAIVKHWNNLSGQLSFIYKHTLHFIIRVISLRSYRQKWNMPIQVVFYHSTHLLKLSVSLERWALSENWTH